MSQPVEYVNGLLGGESADASEAVGLEVERAAGLGPGEHLVQ